MNVTIEEYRGIEIWFDTNNESFQCDIDNEGSIKKSYPAIKKFIDEWKKEELNFKRFKVDVNPLNPHWGKKGTIIGIRKDGRFIIELENGKKTQVSDYDLSSYMLVNEENKYCLLGLEQLEKEQSEADEKFKIRRAELKENLKIVTLKDVKPNYL